MAYELIAALLFGCAILLSAGLAAYLSYHFGLIKERKRWTDKANESRWGGFVDHHRMYVVMRVHGYCLLAQAYREKYPQGLDHSSPEIVPEIAGSWSTYSRDIARLSKKPHEQPLPFSADELERRGG
jgi:hypothetical protein